jgi:hypothetical protein
MIRIFFTIIFAALIFDISLCQEITYREDNSLPVSMWIPYFDDPAMPDVDTLFANLFYSYYKITEAEDTISGYRFTCHNGKIKNNWFTAPKSNAPYIFLDSLSYEHVSCDHGRRIEYQPTIGLRLESDTILFIDSLARLNIWVVDSPGNSCECQLKYSTPITVQQLFPGKFVDIDFPSFFSAESKTNMVLRYQLVSLGKYEFSVDWLKVSNCSARTILSGAYDNLITCEYDDNPGLFKWRLREVRHDQLLPAKHLASLILKAESRGGVIPASILQQPE